VARIEIGLATGAPFRMFSAFDVDPADYMARFSEGLRLMQQVWTGPRVDLDGRFWQLRNVLFA
jgi:alkanesulfonate monooxygenase SsuD/methylene tetrahydromethanopterin reductase-like flavin-dependent oxidoreductase (luciferase family)